MSNINLAVRPMTDKDKPFIMATWLKGIYYDITECLRPNSKQFFTQHGKRIEELFARDACEVRVLGDTDDLLWIFGYAVTLGPDLYFIYVRKDYRRQGFAKALLSGLTITHVRTLTKLGAELSEKHGLIFKPLGDDDGRTQIRSKGTQTQDSKRTVS